MRLSILGRVCQTLWMRRTKFSRSVVAVIFISTGLIPISASSAEAAELTYPEFKLSNTAPAYEDPELKYRYELDRSSLVPSQPMSVMLSTIQNSGLQPSETKTSPTTLIVKISSAIGDPSGKVPNFSLEAQQQFELKTKKISEKFGAIRVNNITLFKGKSYVLQRWDFSNSKDLSVAKVGLQKENGILGFQQDIIVQIQKTPNEPEFSKLWGIMNIKAPAAWDRATGSKNVVVAVIDTGIALNHPDLKNNIWKNIREIANDGLDNDNNGYIDDVNGWDYVDDDPNPNDDIPTPYPGSQGHGTHVAGTIAAEGNNNIGVVGVNWNASLMALRICGLYGCYLSDFWAALVYAYNNGAQVANASFGGQYAPQQFEEDVIKSVSLPGDSPLQKGVLLVAAAGNAASNNDRINFCPACYQLPNVVSVAATRNSNDNLAGFSNYGSKKVSLAAPGESIYSTLVPGAFSQSLYYGYLSGTSMAAPHVAGAAALFQSQFSNWKPSEIKKALIKSSRRTASLATKVLSGGVIDVQSLLNISTVPKPIVVVDLKGTGKGKITVMGVDCYDHCVVEVPVSTNITIAATASTGSKFLQWKDDCTGTSSSCNLSQTEAGLYITGYFSGPPLVSHSQDILKSSASTPVSNADTYQYWDNFVSTSLSEDRSTRARAIFRFPSGGWCYFAGSDTGGITVQNENSGIESKKWTAPYIGTSEPIGRYSNCLGYGNKLQQTPDGKYVATTLPHFIFPRDWEDDSSWYYGCGNYLYKNTLAGGWSEGVWIGPSSTVDCFRDVIKTKTSWQGTWNWIDPYLSEDHTKLFVSNVTKIQVITLEEDQIIRRTDVTLPIGCQNWGKIKSNKDATKLFVPTRGCVDNAKVLIYEDKSAGWTLSTRIMNQSISGYSVVSATISSNGSFYAISTYDNTFLYELTQGAWKLVRELNKSGRYYSGTTCKFISLDNSRLICSNKYVDVGNNSQQGVLLVYDRVSESWTQPPDLTLLWDTNGMPYENMELQSASNDGTKIDATISGMGIGSGDFAENFMGITFTLIKTKPTNISPPTVQGNTAVGSKLITSDGQWDASPAPTMSYEWLSCVSPTSTLSAGCTAIPNEFRADYTVQMSVIGRYIKAKVTAKNSGGVESATSISANPIGQIPIPSKNLAISGLQKVGSTVSITIPVWSGLPQPSYTYQWVRCVAPISDQLDRVPNDCENILNAKGISYIQTSSDSGKFVTIVVNGSNIHGSVLSTAIMKKSVESSPVMILAPTTSGDAKVGQILTLKGGTWQGNPKPTVQYSWSVCVDSTNVNGCKSIAGANQSSYKVSQGDAGKFIRVSETAKNIVGTEIGYSQPTAVVTLPPTGNGTLKVTGLPQVGRVLSSSDSLRWQGFPAPSITNAWYKCLTPIKSQTTNLPAGCSLISNAISPTYNLVESDSGSYISAARIASSVSGRTEIISSSTISSISMAPKNLGLPVISGSNKLKQVIAVKEGVWKGFPAPTLSYQWVACLSSSDDKNCSPIEGATKKTLLLTPSLVGKYIKVIERGINTQGNSTVFSVSTGQISR